MKLKIELDMDGAAFSECPDFNFPREEVTRILDAALSRLSFDTQSRVTLFDINGNPVGTAEVQ